MPAKATCVWASCELEPRRRPSPLAGDPWGALPSELPPLAAGAPGSFCV